MSTGSYLFEKEEDNIPVDSYRLALGKLGTVTKNITLDKFVILLTGKLPFLKTANNLSEIASSAAAARSNLSVYSIDSVDGFLSQKQATITSVYNENALLILEDHIDAFFCKVSRWGNFVTVQGTLNIKSRPTTGDLCYMLPSTVGVCTQDVYFSGHVADGLHHSKFCLFANTREVHILDPINTAVHYFNFSYIIG